MEWVRGEMIGKGSFGSVYVATPRKDSPLMAVLTLLFIYFLPSSSLQNNQENRVGVVVAMKDKGKAIAVVSDNYSSDHLPCKKHPSSSTVGICAYCLKDRLIKLVCSDCGEQRLSSCSCSDDITSISSSFQNSCSVDIGSVGRVSFLIENDNDDVVSNCSKSSLKQRSEVNHVLLKRSSSTSTSIDVKKTGKFWRFGRLFRKKREKDIDEEEGENRGVSRSRSLCGYRGRFIDLSRIGNADSVNEFKNVKKGLFGLGGSFREGEDPDFIDLKLGLSVESKSELCSIKGELSRCQSQSSEYLRGDHGMFSNGSSCRITVDNNERKNCRKSFKIWKWIVKHNSSNAGCIVAEMCITKNSWEEELK